MNEGPHQNRDGPEFNALPMRQWRVHLAELLLLATSVLLTYLACEAAFSLFGLRYLPLRLHEYLPTQIRIFAQSSKAGVVPRHLVLLLGTPTPKAEATGSSRPTRTVIRPLVPPMSSTT